VFSHTEYSAVIRTLLSGLWSPMVSMNAKILRKISFITKVMLFFHIFTRGTIFVKTIALELRVYFDRKYYTIRFDVYSGLCFTWYIFYVTLSQKGFPDINNIHHKINVINHAVSIYCKYVFIYHNNYFNKLHINKRTLQIMRYCILKRLILTIYWKPHDYNTLFYGEYYLCLEILSA